MCRGVGLRVDTRHTRYSALTRVGCDIGCVAARISVCAAQRGYSGKFYTLCQAPKILYRCIGAREVLASVLRLRSNVSGRLDLVSACALAGHTHDGACSPLLSDLAPLAALVAEVSIVLHTFSTVSITLVHMLVPSSLRGADVGVGGAVM